MEQLTKENNKIHLLLVGPDELNGYYQKIVDIKKLNDKIHFLGRREDIPQLLAISDIIVSASKREGLPVNVIEAFASGIPVVALECRGMKDLITSGKNGYICNNINEYKKNILLLINDKKIYNKISNNNISKTKKYNLNTIIKYVKDNIYN